MKNINLSRRLLIHGTAGCLAGLLFLHPVSMFIFNIYGHFTPVNFLDPEHLLMAVYFALLGTAIGMANGFYIHKKTLLYKEIELLSITDELTSLYNRRFFSNQLAKEMERAKRYQRPLSIMMIDLNNFKQYNDTHGHQSGDEMLKEIASLLKRSARKPDFVARFGGDEFVIVMPEADRDKALKVADRLQAEVESANFTDISSHTEARFTISLGLATFPEEVRDIDELISLADTRLYEMKRQLSGS